MAKNKYLFIRLDEAGASTQLTDSLDSFKSFCHYSSLSDWAEHEKLIKKCLQRGSQYGFTENEVWYYILTYPTWEDISSSDLTITIKGDN